MIGLAWCGAEPGKMFVGCASKKPGAAVGAAEIGSKFCSQWNKTASRGNHVFMVMSNDSSSELDVMFILLPLFRYDAKHVTRLLFS